MSVFKMRQGTWMGVIGAALFALGAHSALAQQPKGEPSQATLQRIYKPALPGGKVRTTYIAAEEVDWDYAPAGRDEMMGHDFMDEAKVFVERKDGRVGRVHRKAIYVEYIDDRFETRKPKPASPRTKSTN